MIRRLFNSLNNQSVNVIIYICFVNQNECIFDGFDFNENIKLDVIEMNEIIPLSVARNMAISHVNLLDFDVVAFPDDDCWYDDDLIKKILYHFDYNLSFNVICTNVIDPSNNKTYGGRPTGTITSISNRNIFSYPISVGIFIRINNKNVKQIFFDESLGAGTDIGSGEETELIYRFIREKERCIYIGNIYVYHPVVDGDYRSEDIIKYYKYAVGFGHLTRRMVNKKDYVVMFHFSYIAFRTLIGICVSLNHDINRKVYLNRFKGMFSGFLRAK
ncbi:hypothetical protein [Aeromonas bestiarum]|uniref:hypothetical protein n=1 Tax=Aeromonas bestiarum TaxID=105751 RepID=UPI0015E1AF7F|nr:hypothetical protein [Aeromonas bestiarum]